MSSSLQLQPLFDLARGGMGVVSVAMRAEGRFQRLYVIKRLLPELHRDESTRAMFLEEARIAGHLRHPNIVGVLDVGTDSKGPYLVMEYIDGLTAHELLKLLKGQPMPLQIALYLSLDITRGLAAAHEATDASGAPLNIVHRDVSPQNVLIGFDGTARLSDFGIARAAGRTNKTATGILKGKLSYMAPEQLRFEAPSMRTDLFSLGVVLFELFTGARLYPLGIDGVEGPKRILSEAPPDLGDIRPDAPPALVQLMFELLAKQPEQRPTSAREVERALSEVLVDLQGSEPIRRVADFVSRTAERERAARKARIDAAMAAPRAGKSLPRGPLMAAGVLLVGAAYGLTQIGGGASDVAVPAPEPVNEPPTATAPAAPVSVSAPERDAPEPETDPPEASAEMTRASPRRRAVRRRNRAASSMALAMEPGMAPEPRLPERRSGEPSPRRGAGTWDWEDPQ